MENLLELTERHREMVRLEMEGKGPKEIGEILGINRQHVGKLLNYDEKVDEYRQELVKERERELKRVRVRAELRLGERVEELVEQMYKIAMHGDTDGVKLNACVKGLQLVGMRFDGKEEVMVKAPKIIIRDSTERVKGDGVTKTSEEVGDDDI